MCTGVQAISCGVTSPHFGIKVYGTLAFPRLILILYRRATVCTRSSFILGLVRANIHNVEKIRQEVLAICHHSVKPYDESTSPIQQHRYCPKGTSSCCKFWINTANTTTFYDKSQRLLSPFFSHL